MGNGAHSSSTCLAPAADQRVGGERRKRPTPILSRYTFAGGRRGHFRRPHEATCSFVDRHGAALFLVVAAVTALNMLDAFFTILFLSHGGTELNPVVQASLDLGPWWFITLKSLGIGVCVVFLTLTKNFVASRIGLGVILIGYLALLGWHLWLYLGLGLGLGLSEH